MGVEVRISSSALRRILKDAAASPDREVCGLLLGDGRTIDAAMPTANVAANPADSFEIDPAIHFAALRAARRHGPSVMGNFHSHPAGPARPSSRDQAAALDPGQLWLIVAGDDATLWRVAAPGRLVAVPLVVA